MSDCKERILPSCDKQIAEGVAGNCPSWSVCLPFGGNLRTEGGCIHYDAPQSVPEDGEYSRIVIANGCIVDAKKAEIPLYTSTPCAPVPAPCDCGGGSESLPEPSPQTGNLYKYDLQGRPLVKLSVGVGSGISVTGTGTSSDPLIITNTREEKDTGNIKSGTSVIKISGTGTVSDPKVISHELGKQGKFLGLTFDEYGHLVDYEKEGAKGITGIVGTNGVKATTDLNSGVCTIETAPPIYKRDGDYIIGGYKVTLDENNAVYNVEKEIEITEGVYAFGQYDVELNELGSVTDIKDTFNPGDEYVKYFNGVGGDAVREGTFTLRRTAYLRIVYEGVMTAAERNNISIRVNGRPLTTTYQSYATGAVGGTVVGTVEAITQSVMAAGEHTIQIVLASGTFNAGYDAKITVKPSWLFEQ